MSDRNVKLMPRTEHEKRRRNDLARAIRKCTENNLEIPSEWIEEYNELAALRESQIDALIEGINSAYARFLFEHPEGGSE